MQDKWANCIESVAVFFWGPPTTRKPEELRWGTHGSKVVNLQDGTWYNFEEEIGGGCTKLIETYAQKAQRLRTFYMMLLDLRSLKSVKILMTSLLRPKKKLYMIIKTSQVKRYTRLYDTNQKHLDNDN